MELHRSQERIFIMVNLLVGILENPHTQQRGRKKTGIKSRNKIKGGMALARGGYDRLHSSSLTRFSCGTDWSAHIWPDRRQWMLFVLLSSRWDFGALRSKTLIRFVHRWYIELWMQWKQLADFTFAAFIILCEFSAENQSGMQKLLHERHITSGPKIFLFE